MKLIGDCLSSNIITTLASEFLIRIIHLVFVLFGVILTEVSVTLDPKYTKI